jgi:ATP-dependent Clp protease ATP-binding subunit ClpC
MALPHLDGDAQMIVKLANEIAQELGLEYVGTEHILLGILRHNQGIGAQVLRNLGVDEKRATAEVKRMMRAAKEDTWVFGRLPSSPHHRNVMALAIDEAVQLESREIRSEHLLLALLREKGSAAQRVLSKLSVTLTAVRSEVLRTLSNAKPA